jgi:hypothetical protein
MLIGFCLTAAGFVYAIRPDFYGIEEAWPFEAGWFTLLYLGLFILTQCIFLQPRLGRHLAKGERGRPMVLAIIGVSFFAALLSVGALTTLLELPNLWEGILEGMGNGFWYAVVAVWLVWGLVFYYHLRSRDVSSGLAKAIRWLIGGSFLELFAATAVYAWNPHDEDCWCARGSYLGLVFGFTVLCWSFGPGVILLVVREHRRRAPSSGD